MLVWYGIGNYVECFAFLNKVLLLFDDIFLK